MEVPAPAPGTAGALDATRQPLITYCDEATGERTELSAVELGNWAARTAHLLVDGCGLGPGSRAAVLLPPHWQTAAVLLGAWSAGISVAFHGWATAGLPATGPGADLPPDVTFVSSARLNSWLENVPDAPHRFVLGLAAGAAPLPEVPDGYRDYLAALPDLDSPAAPTTVIGRGEAASTDGTTYRQWGSIAAAIATDRDIRPGDRVIVDTAADAHPVSWLLAPLAAGASVVLCANADPESLAARAGSEPATRLR